MSANVEAIIRNFGEKQVTPKCRQKKWMSSDEVFGALQMIFFRGAPLICLCEVQRPVPGVEDAGLRDPRHKSSKNFTPSVTSGGLSLLVFATPATYSLARVAQVQDTLDKITFLAPLQPRKTSQCPTLRDTYANSFIHV